MTDLGKVPGPTSIQNKENGRGYLVTPNIIFGKAPKLASTSPLKMEIPVNVMYLSVTRVAQYFGGDGHGNRAAQERRPEAHR
jgi:hypothetical protein